MDSDLYAVRMEKIGSVIVGLMDLALKSERGRSLANLKLTFSSLAGLQALTISLARP